MTRPIALAAILFGASACASKDGTRDTPTDGTKAPSSPSSEMIDYEALFVVNGQDASISVIDVATSEVKKSIALIGAVFPHHIGLSPDGARLAVAVPGMDLSGGHDEPSASPTSTETSTGMAHGGHLTAMAGKILLVDAATGVVGVTRELPAMNHNAAFSPDGKEIWTSQMQDEGQVLVLDAETLATMVTIGVGAGPAEVTFSKGGKYAFAANGVDDTVSVIDVATRVVVKTIVVGDGPVGAWPGGDGLMYVDDETGKTLHAIDPATLEVVRVYKLGFMPGMAATSADGSLWVTDGDNGRVVKYMAGMDMKEAEVVTGAGAHGIAFSTDGTRMFVSNQGAGTVTVVDVAAARAVADVKVGQKPNGLVIRRP